MNPSPGQHSVIFAAGGLWAGGASEFVSNILEGLPGTPWKSSALVASILAEVGENMLARGLEVTGPCDPGGLVEDCIGATYRELAKKQPEVVVASLGLEAFELLRLVPAGVLRVAMVHSDDPNVYQTIVDYSRWIDMIGCVSLRACERMVEIQPEAAPKVEYLPYGVRMAEGPRRPKDGCCRIIYLGRVIEGQKRMSIQLRVMEETLEANPDLVWTMAGDGPARAEMEGRLARWGERVRFLGQVPNESVPDLLLEQDLFFLCSDYEGLPLSLLEAMSAGVVPVVSDLPSGIRQVVDDSTGIRVDPDSGPAAYTAAVLALAADPQRRDALSAACRTRVKDDYSIPAMARRWSDMLLRRLESGSRAAPWPANAQVPPLLGFEDKWRFDPKLRPFRRIGKVWKRKWRERQANKA